MLVHSVFFWLKKDVDSKTKDIFEKALLDLKRVTSVKTLYVGKPVPSERPVVEASYSFALTVIFENLTEHDRYQEDPIHLSFIDNYHHVWDKVLVYDAE